MRFFTVMLFTIPLAACSKHAPQLEFKPEKGAERDYQIIVQTHISTESSYGQSQDTIRSMMLTNYQVTHASTEGEHGKGVRLHIQPNFMLTEFRNGDFASSREPSWIDQDMRHVMRQGFDMQLSAEMEVTEFQIKALNDPSPDEAILESLPPGSTAEQDLLHMFRDEFTRPGLAHGLALQEGATREIPAQNERPAVRVTLQELRSNEAILTIEGQSAAQDSQTKLFGIAAVDILTGWVNRATMVTDIQYQEQGSTASVRSIMSLYPGDWVMGMELDYLGETSMMPLQQNIDFTNLAKPAERAQTLASTTGTIEHQHDHMRLMYHHSNELTDTRALGQFALRSAQAYSIDGKPLELELQLSEAINYSHHGGETLQTFSTLGN